MKQILHIFAKDARHFLPEILVSLAITIALAWTYPNQWLAAGGGSTFVPEELVLLASLLALLVPVGWWLLISRVVHAENLVGDRQFWITRPYRWQDLLAAKALFLLCFLYLPIVLAQCYLLLRAGFSPLSYLPGLVYNLLLLTAIIVLPLFAVSAVTSSFARNTLTVLAILLGLIAIIIFFSAARHLGISNPLPDRIALPLALCGLAAIVAFQYFKRSTALARLLLVALVILLWAISSFLSRNAVIDSAYPHAANLQFPSLQMKTGDSANNVPGSSLDQPIAYQRGQKQVIIRIPLQISGIANEDAWSPDNVKVSIESPQGPVWSSPWQLMRNGYYLPNAQDFNADFQLPRAVFERLQSTPVTLHLTFAWTELRRGRVRQVAIPAHEFTVPGFGICSPAVYLATPSQIDGVSCRFALRQPTLTYMSTLWSEDACPSPATIPGSGWTGTLDTAPADFSIATVWTLPLPLTNNLYSERHTRSRHICAGTPLTLAEYTVAQRGQSGFTIPGFRFPELKALAGAGAGGVSVGISPR